MIVQLHRLSVSSTISADSASLSVGILAAVYLVYASLGQVIASGHQIVLEPECGNQAASN